MASGREKKTASAKIKDLLEQLSGVRVSSDPSARPGFHLCWAPRHRRGPLHPEHRPFLRVARQSQKALPKPRPGPSALGLLRALEAPFMTLHCESNALACGNGPPGDKLTLQASSGTGQPSARDGNAASSVSLASTPDGGTIFLPFWRTEALRCEITPRPQG